MDAKRTSQMDGQSSGMLKGRDVHMDLEIDFMDAVRGTSK